MTFSTNFVPGTVITSDWLNAVNNCIYGGLNGAVTIPDILTVLGLTTVLKSTDIGVNVEGYDTTILKSTAIGVTVEGYDATILKTVDVGTNVGYVNIPQNSQSGAYGLVLGDQGKHILHPASDNNPRTFTIPANASVAYPIGTCLTFANLINTVTIAITSDTMYWAVDGTTTSRTLSVYGLASALKVGATSWLISGTGLS